MDEACGGREYRELYLLKFSFEQFLNERARQSGEMYVMYFICSRCVKRKEDSMKFRTDKHKRTLKNEEEEEEEDEWRAYVRAKRTGDPRLAIVNVANAVADANESTHTHTPL